MLVCSILLATLCSYVGKVLTHKLINPITLTNGLWVLVLCLTPLSESVGVDFPTEQALIIVFFGILALNVGFFLSMGCSFTIGKKHGNENKNYVYVANMRILYLFTIIALISTAINATDSIINLINGVNVSNIREDYYAVTENENALMYYFRTYVGLPLQYTVISAGIYEIISGNKNQFLITSSVLIILFSVIGSGGRYIMVNSVYMIIAALGTTVLFQKLGRKVKRRIFIGAAVLFIAVIILTNARPLSVVSNEKSTIENILITIYIYFSAGVTYMGKLIETYPLAVNQTYGLGFLSGFVSPVFALFSFLGIMNFPEKISFVSNVTNLPFSIGSSYSHNALPTAFYYFYMDFGIAGVMIEALIIGFVGMLLYKNLSKRNDWLSKCTYMLGMVILLNVPLKNLLYSSSFALAFVYLRIACKKKMVKNVSISQLGLDKV